jgi:PAS domain S-box-containing protein
MTAAAEPDFEFDASPDLALFDAATDLMCVRDMQGRLVRVNQAWEATLGLSMYEVTNTPLLPLIHPADAPATLSVMAEADRCLEVVDFVNRYRRRDGLYRSMQWRARRIGDVIVGRARDVTVHYGVESELRIASARLDEALADIGDRLRAPSNEIFELVRALNRTELTPEQRAMMQVLGRTVQTLTDLVHQLGDQEHGAARIAGSPALARHRPAGAQRDGRAIELTLLRHATPEKSAGDVSEGLQAWVIDMSQHVDEHPTTHRNLRDFPSQTLGLLAIRLDYLGQFHARRLQGLAAESGLMSSGRAATLLARMQDIDFIKPIGPFRSGQVRPYRVQPAMTKAYAGLMMISLKSLAATDRRATLAIEDILADEKRITPLLAAFAAVLLEDLRSTRGSLGRRLNGVPMMAKGQAIAIAIGTEAIVTHGAAWEGWIDAAPTAYAQRFDVSRVHVQRIIERLKCTGLLRDSSLPSRLLVTRRYREEIAGYHAAICELLRIALGRVAEG